MVTYPIVETFHSVQGEGFWTGVNAFFIRLAGCNVHCPWCDQKETWNEKRYPQVDLQQLVAAVQQANPAIVIITGGEPLQHDLYPLTSALQGVRIHLETSGAYPFSGDFDWVTFSPKPYKLPHESVYARVNELKVVIANHDDFFWAEQQAGHLPKDTLKYLQPEWSTPESNQLVFAYVLRHPQWRISLQTHKLIGVR